MPIRTETAIVSAYHRGSLGGQIPEMQPTARDLYPFHARRVIATKVMAGESKHCGFADRLCSAMRLTVQEGSAHKECFLLTVRVTAVIVIFTFSAGLASAQF